MTVQQRIQAGDGDARHGTANGYSNHDCRCEKCRAAWAAHTTTRRKRRNERLARSAVQHGSESTYVNWLCRCPACTRAHADAEKARKKKRAS